MTHLEHAGWDTEYDQDEATGRQAPVTTQLYLPEIFPHTNERLRLSDHLGKELLTCTAIPDRGTTLVFDDRGLTAGAEYYERFKARWLTLIDILQLTTDKRGLILWTHYSNAEIANIAATNDEFRSLMKANGDTLCIENPYKNENLRLFPKGKSFNLRNLKITESFKISVFDTTHLYAKTTLALLGMSINFPKLEHPDWDKVSASEWLKSDEKAFLEYAAFDAAIPCEAAIQLYDGVKQTIHDLADMGLIPHIGDKTVQRVLNKQWMTASSMSENIAKLCFIQQGVWKDWDEAAEDLVQNLPENALTKVKGGLNKYFTSDKPQHFDNVAAYDIKSAYASALKQIQYPLWKPEHFATNESISFHDLATKLDGYQGAYLNIEYALPEGANEWERALVFQNPRNYAGFTGRVTGKYQWFTHFEIQAQASITPSVIVKVVQGIGWKKRRVAK